MIFELRTYDLRPGTAVEYLNLFRSEGVGFITRHLPMGGYWMTETGGLNRIHHLWIYEDFAERAACRDKVAQDRDWNGTFVPRAFPLIVAQRNGFLSLAQGSETLNAVVAARRLAHASQTPEQSLFAPGLQALTYTSGPVPQENLIAHWRVVSGYRPGAQVALHTLPPEELMTDKGEVIEHEIIRPLSVSPLR